MEEKFKNLQTGVCFSAKQTYKSKIDNQTLSQKWAWLFLSGPLEKPQILKNDKFQNIK